MSAGLAPGEFVPGLVGKEPRRAPDGHGGRPEHVGGRREDGQAWIQSVRNLDRSATDYGPWLQDGGSG